MAIYSNRIVVSISKAGIGPWLRITNSQNIPTQTGLQVMWQVPVNTLQTRFPSLNSDLSNLRFVYNGQYIPAWLESINNGTATIWIKMPVSIPANSSITLNLYANPGLNFDGVYWGEAPQLSPIYGQYDNGANVFNFYTNYAGTSVPNGFAIANDGAGGSVIINNGANITSKSTTSTYGEFIYYTTPQNPAGIIIESLITSVSSNSYDKLIGYDLSSPTSQGSGTWWGWGNGVGAGIHHTTPYNQMVSISGRTATHTDSLLSSFPSIVSLSWQATNTATATFNYNRDSITISSTPTIGNSYLVSGYANGAGSITTQWFRVRAYPPNGVMPSVELM
jgi:hypothetical protein